MRDVLDLAYEVAELDDIKFIEFFAALRLQMLNHVFGSVDPDDINKQAIYDVLAPIDIFGNGEETYKNLFDWLYRVYREVVCEDHIDANAWWKE